jgi:hypothetical protein
MEKKFAFGYGGQKKVNLNTMKYDVRGPLVSVMGLLGSGGL